MASRLDIVVFGATSFTGKYTLPEVHKLTKAGKRPLSWGVAGRSELKLKDALKDAAEKIGVGNLNSVPIIIADVKDEESIKKMTARAKVIINLCGPFAKYGEVVIKSCIETGTDYVDVCAEVQFIQDMVVKYYKDAEDKGVYIVQSCGVSSVCTDVGLLFVQQNFKGTLCSAEVYLHVYNDKEVGSGSKMNYATWESYIHFMKNLTNFILRRPVLPLFGPNLPMRLPLRKTNLSGGDSKWALQLPFMAADTIAPSQLYFYERCGKVLPQMRGYFIKNSFLESLLTIVIALTAIIVAQFDCGVNLLLKFPQFFTLGLFSKEEPSEEDLEHTFFSCTFHGKGWSEELTKDNQHIGQLPDKETVGVVRGKNPAYGSASVAVTSCALMILTQRNKLPPKGGIYAPAAAFEKTTIVEELRKDGIDFEILSVNDL